MQSKLYIISLLILLTAYGCGHSVRDLQAPTEICKTRECFEQYLGKASREGWSQNGNVYIMEWAGHSGDRVFKVPVVGGGDFGTGYTDVTNVNSCALITNFDKNGRLLVWQLVGDCDPATKQVN